MGPISLTDRIDYLITNLLCGIVYMSYYILSTGFTGIENNILSELVRIFSAQNKGIYRTVQWLPETDKKICFYQI